MGDEYSQVLEMDIHPGESVTCEPGSYIFLGNYYCFFFQIFVYVKPKRILKHIVFL